MTDIVERLERLASVADLRGRRFWARYMKKAAAEILHLRAENKRLLRLATDRRYFMLAYRNMLGENGLKVAQMWDEKNVNRIHYSWGEGAHKMAGEERAALILSWEDAPKRLVHPSTIDEDVETDSPTQSVS